MLLIPSEVDRREFQLFAIQVDNQKNMSTQRNRKTEQPLTNKSDSVEFLPKFLQCLQKLIALNSDPRISFEETINRFIVFFRYALRIRLLGASGLKRKKKPLRVTSSTSLPGTAVFLQPLEILQLLYQYCPKNKNLPTILYNQPAV